MGKLISELEPYRMFREAVAAADSDLGAAQRTWAYYLANLTGKAYVPNDTDTSTEETDCNGVQFAFTCKDNDTTGTAVIYGIKRPETDAQKLYTPMEQIYSCTLAAGTQETGDTTARYFADTLVEVYDRWGTVSLSNATGNDGVAKIKFDGEGYYAFIVLFTAIKAADNISVLATYY